MWRDLGFISLRAALQVFPAASDGETAGQWETKSKWPCVGQGRVAMLFINRFSSFLFFFFFFKAPRFTLYVECFRNANFINFSLLSVQVNCISRK